MCTASPTADPCHILNFNQTACIGHRDPVLAGYLRSGKINFILAQNDMPAASECQPQIALAAGRGAANRA
jgi:hypothetical protein